MAAMNDDTFIQRFTQKVEPEPMSGCWLWTGALLESGYGQVFFRGRRRNAHRAAFEHFKGGVPAGLEVHHKCNVRCCVNPDHLEAVSHRHNIRVSDTVMGQNARKTHCKRGHQLDDVNTYITPSGTRCCRVCGAMRARGYQRG